MDFFDANTTTAETVKNNTRMSAALLNSGTVEESDITETVFIALLDTKISPFAES